ncbi:hypothetical protein E8E68_24775 [Pseudomonas sp. BN607]|nr:hypothetical protein [Pseudomonas sp. BN607]
METAGCYHKGGGGGEICTAVHGHCGSGLVSRWGCAAAPAIFASSPGSGGRLAALSRHKAAPTRIAPAFRN